MQRLKSISFREYGLFRHFYEKTIHILPKLGVRLFLHASHPISSMNNLTAAPESSDVPILFLICEAVHKKHDLNVSTCCT